MANTPFTTPFTSVDEKQNKKVWQGLITLFISYAIIISFMAPILAWQWTQLPFLGVLFERDLVVSSSYSPQWLTYQNAEKAGITLNKPDTLIAIDKQPVYTAQDIQDILLSQSLGDELKLTLLDSDPQDSQSELPSEQHLKIIVTQFPRADVFIFFGIPYLCGLAYLTLGLSVYRLKQSQEIHAIFLVFCVLASVILGGVFDLYTYHYFTLIWTLTLPFVPATLIHFSLVFPLEVKFIRQRAWARYVPYILAFGLAMTGLISLLNFSSRLNHLIVWSLDFTYLGIGLLTFFGVGAANWYVNYSSTIRQQLQIMLGGGILAFAPILVWSLGPLTTGQILLLPQTFYILVITPLIFFPTAITYAILRYQVSNLDSIFKTALLYVSLILLVLIIYSGLVGLSRIFLNMSPLTNPITLFFYIAILVIFIGPLRDWLQSFINTRIPDPSEDYQQTLQNYPTQLVTLPLNVDEILNLYLYQIQCNIDVSELNVFLTENLGTVYEIRARYTKQQSEQVQVSYIDSDKLPQWLINHRRPLCLDAQGRPIGRVHISPEEIARLVILNIRVVVPMFGNNKLLGWLTLGEARNKLTYNEEDLAFVSSLTNQTVIALENAQSFERANRKTEELLALQETVLDIASEKETSRIVRSVVEQATNLLVAQGGVLYLLDDEKKVLKSSVIFQLDQDYAPPILHIGEGIAGRAAQENRPQIFGSSATFINEYNFETETEFGPILALPLLWQGKVRGVVEIVRAFNAPIFNQEEINLLTLLANQATIALENTRLLQEANYKAHQLTTINEVSHLISATLERDKSLNLTLQTAVEILNSEAGSIFLVNHTNQTLVFEMTLGPTGLTLIGSKMAMDMNSIAGAIAVTQKALIVNDVAQDARWNSNIDKTTEFQTRDILGVPMVAFGRVVGVIEVINKKNGDGYNENDLMMLTLFATQVGVAIVNAERFTQTDQALASRMQELSTLQMIDRELNATLDFEAVLDLTLSRAMDALGAMIGLIAIVDIEEEGLIFHSHVGVAKEFERFTETPWPLDRGIIGQVARTGHALIANEEHMDIFASDGRSNSQLCVPLMLDETVIGVINLEIADFEPFTEQDLGFAKRLASHASLAVQNSRLFEQVKQANQAKTEFMDVASHDLKTPMTSIKGFARMMLMTAGSEMSDTQKEFINIIIKNVDRMSRLVSDLLDVSRIEAGRIKLECKDVDIKEAIDDVVQSAQAEVQEKNLEMRLEMAQNLPPIWADYDRIVQVLTNLVSNAYKYTPEGGQITIKADVLNDQPASHLSIRVIDTGYGISEEDQKKLFDKFFRSSDPNVSDVPGTGLGLAITKNMIEMHGGQMWFKSKVGEGSTFGFDMPIQH